MRALLVLAATIAVAVILGRVLRPIVEPMARSLVEIVGPVVVLVVIFGAIGWGIWSTRRDRLRAELEHYRATKEIYVPPPDDTPRWLRIANRTMIGILVAIAALTAFAAAMSEFAR